MKEDETSMQIVHVVSALQKERHLLAHTEFNGKPMLHPKKHSKSDTNVPAVHSGTARILSVFQNDPKDLGPMLMREYTAVS